MQKIVIVIYMPSKYYVAYSREDSEADCMIPYLTEQVENAFNYSSKEQAEAAILTFCPVEGTSCAVEEVTVS